MLDRAFECLPGQVEAVELGIAALEPGENPQGLIIVRKSPEACHLAVERFFAGMAERGVSQIMGEPLVKLVPVLKERKPRVPGRYKGQFSIAPDCFEPMSEDDLDLWEKWDHED